MHLELALAKTDAADLGAVYTPPFLAEWVAEELLSLVSMEKKCLNPRILDPACGDGALLEAVSNVSSGSALLAGVDIDQAAVNEALIRLGPGASIRAADSLLDPLKELGSGRSDGVIANPPWGADLRMSKEQLRAAGYELARGQCDSFELFVEKCVREAPPGTPMAFIVPDSVFLPEHESFRRLLVNRCELKSISRLGEGFFPGVFRGTVVLLFRSGPPSKGNLVSCLQLTATQRQQVLRGKMELAVAKRACAHLVQQHRFGSNPRFELDIDVRSAESITLQRFDVRPMDWTRWVTVGRGVELGKAGVVIRCPVCQHHRPIPRDGKVSCKGCGGALSQDPSDRVSIVRPLGNPTPARWWPLIVGVDVDRYECAPSREIQLGLPGIQYKPHHEFLARKLLVRKTGIGLKAAIDESGSYTTQVVFHFISQENAPEFMLDYLQGVLSSRIMLAFHLRTSGENQWRSHPYVTPKILTSLPIPDVGSPDIYSKAAEIAAAARKRRTLAEDLEADIHVDRLIADLFMLTDVDCEWVVSVLDSAQSMQSIAPLRLKNAADLYPKRESGNVISVHR